MTPLLVAQGRPADPTPSNSYTDFLDNFDHHRWMFTEDSGPYADGGNATDQFDVAPRTQSSRVTGNNTGPIFGLPIQGAVLYVGQYPGGDFYNLENLTGTSTWIDQPTVGAFGGFFRAGFPGDKDLMDLASQSSGSNNLTVSQHIILSLVEVSNAWHVRLLIQSGSNEQYWQTDNPVWDDDNRLGEWRHIVAVQPGDGGGVHLVIDGVDVAVSRTVASGSVSVDDWLDDIAAPNSGSYIRFGPRPVNASFNPEASAFGVSGCFIVNEAFSVQDAIDLHDSASTDATTPADYDEAIKLIHQDNASNDLPEVWIPYLSPRPSGKYFSLGNLQGGYLVHQDNANATVTPTVAQVGKLRRRGARSDSTSWIAGATVGNWPRRFGSISGANEGTIGFVFRYPGSTFTSPKGLCSWTTIQTGTGPKCSFELLANAGVRVFIQDGSGNRAVWSVDATDGVSFTLSDWYRMYFVKDGTNCTVYINGTAYSMNFASNGTGANTWWVDTLDSTQTDHYLGFSPRDTSGQQVRDLNEPMADFMCSLYKFTQADVDRIETAVEFAASV